MSEEQEEAGDLLTDSEESVYSGLEDSGSDSLTEEEEDQDHGAEEKKSKGKLRSRNTQAGEAAEPGTAADQREPPLPNEYEEDSSDEEVRSPRLLRVVKQPLGFSGRGVRRASRPVRQQRRLVASPFAGLRPAHLEGLVGLERLARRRPHTPRSESLGLL
ncbi:ribosome biogenesis protein bop1-like [Pseudonaja textilis]|uniref:ribosome biogenesis protein bop1-like n=1 Tax=Pseudonaja textilis TaxID=8673 RepID=UPI000EA98BF7|nr:ribosome biogenesis protein bop1-like [Pseudonaja textilis]